MCTKLVALLIVSCVFVQVSGLPSRRHHAHLTSSGAKLSAIQAHMKQHAAAHAHPAATHELEEAEIQKGRRVAADVERIGMTMKHSNVPEAARDNYNQMKKDATILSHSTNKAERTRLAQAIHLRSTALRQQLEEHTESHASVIPHPVAGKPTHAVTTRAADKVKANAVVRDLHALEAQLGSQHLAADERAAIHRQMHAMETEATRFASAPSAASRAQLAHKLVADMSALRAKIEAKGDSDNESDLEGASLEEESDADSADLEEDSESGDGEGSDLEENGESDSEASVDGDDLEESIEGSDLEEDDNESDDDDNEATAALEEESDLEEEGEASDLEESEGSDLEEEAASDNDDDNEVEASDLEEDSEGSDLEEEAAATLQADSDLEEEGSDLEEESVEGSDLEENDSDDGESEGDSQDLEEDSEASEDSE